MTPKIFLAAAVAAAAGTASAQTARTGLVVGTADADLPVRIDDDPGSGTYDDLFTGAEIRGLTFAEGLLYASELSDFVSYTLDGDRTEVGTFSADGGTTPQAIVGLAYDADAGVLYASDTSGSTAGESDPEGIYTVDLATGATTNVFNFPAAGIRLDYSLGGLAFDGDGGLLYATNNDADGQGNGRGLFRIDLVGQSVDFVASFPAGVDDVDGLAYGDGSLFLTTNPGGDFYEYDLAAGTYAQFRGAYADDPPQFFGASNGAAFIPVPEPASAGLLAVAGLALVRRRR